MAQTGKRTRARATGESKAPAPPGESSTFLPAEIGFPALRQMPQTVPAEAVPQDQVNFLKKLMEDDSEPDHTLQTAEEDPDNFMEVLVFQLGQERYGLDIHRISQIIRFIEPAVVPHTVGFLDGIVSLRGRMIPVINGRKRLGHDPKPPDKKTRIIVLREQSEFQGILVDAATQVIKLEKKNIEPTPPVVTGMKAKFIDGVCELKGQLIILLNLDRFLEMMH